MTSNLASEEIANHALELRREAKEAAEHREEGERRTKEVFEFFLSLERYSYSLEKWFRSSNHL